MSSWNRDYSALRYSVQSRRDGTKVNIWVREDPHGRSVWSRNVCLKDCFWHFNSPKTRLEGTRYKAELVADRRNRSVLYINRDYEIYDERFEES